jgi:raffinose/stachyose/melibiose transport system substrate-binding protein
MKLRLAAAANVVGLLLVGVVFAYAATRVWQRTREEADDGRVTLRFAHWQLESGVGEAFAAMIAAYEGINPKVKVIQMRIPERVYAQWAMTQLIGGTAPDIMELGPTLETVVQARHFEPLSRFVNDPNPYNEGVPLEGVPWRSTFIDGLASGYTEKLADYYGIPCFFATIRVFVNGELLREITGSDALPESFDTFLAVCGRVREHAAETGRRIVPIAGSRDNAPYLLDQAFETVLQKRVHASGFIPNLHPSPDSFFLGYLRGEWSLDDPEPRAGLGLMRSLGRELSPGFLQLRRDDALFAFVQGRALMVAAGSWEASGLNAQAPFPIRVMRLPLPERDHPEFGKFTWGPPAEASGRASTGPFAIYNGTKHFDVALDFLRFLSSQSVHRAFVQRSGWLPVVTGVEAPASMAGFEPKLDGALQGLSLRWGTEIRRVTETHWHTLFAEDGGVEAFIAATREAYGKGVLADLRRRDRRAFIEMGLADPGLEANRQLGLRRPDDEALRRKYEAMLQAQNEREIYYYQMHERLAELEASSPR